MAMIDKTIAFFLLDSSRWHMLANHRRGASWAISALSACGQQQFE